MRIHEIGEFGLIDRLADVLGPRDESVVVGIGDDAAVLQYAQGMQVVTTTDLLVEGVHFRTDTIDDRSLGWKSVAVSLSDIAAMGGRPRHVVIGLAVPVTMEVERLEDLYAGVADVCRTYGAHVVGGDITKTDGPFVIAVTVLGEVEQGQALLRSGAGPGDLVYVTGTVGGSAAGLDFLQKGIQESTGLRPEQAADLLHFHQVPQPQVEAGRLLRSSGGCTSANDVSDGLASELNEIAKMSGVRLAVEAGKIPLHDSVSRYAQLRGVDPVEWAMFGGEDYQLVGTLRADAAERVKALFAEQGLLLTVIGRVEEGHGVVLQRDGGEVREVTAKGYNHFG
jgi:thiamine-monophosphate kinase